jgi:hypothetical protein
MGTILLLQGLPKTKTVLDCDKGAVTATIAIWQEMKFNSKQGTSDIYYL